MFSAMANVSSRKVLALALTAIAIGAAPAHAADTLKFLVPWTQSNESNWKTALAIIEAVKEKSSGKLEAKYFGPSVVPPFKQLEPVSSGAFDLHYTSTAYHAGATSIGQLGDTVTRDQAKRLSSGLWDIIDKHYQKTQHVKVLGFAASTGYQILLKEPIGSDGGLAGRKIRGNPAYEPLITAMGGSVVTLPPTQIYTSLQKNLIDGAAWTVHSMISNRFNEVVRYMARPTFAVSTNLLLINLDRWNKLSDDQRAALLEVGKVFETLAYDIPAKIAERDFKEMQEKGVKVTKFGDKYASNINGIYNDGVWRRIINQHGAEAEAIVKLIKDKGLAHK